jgi:hypothetical protein
MNFKPILLLAGAAGAAAAVVKRRGQVPEPVAQAASSAAETVQRAVQNVTPGNGGGDDQPHERYEPPIEAGAQQPTEAGGPPSSDAAVSPPEPMVSQPGIGGLNEPEHGPPEGSVMPDTSDDDPLVRQQEKAAAGDAGAIGGNVNALAADDESFERDPAARPVAEGSGDESFEAFETREDTERSNREREP